MTVGVAGGRIFFPRRIILYMTISLYLNTFRRLNYMDDSTIIYNIIIM